MRLAIVNPQEKAGKINTSLAFARTLAKRNNKVLVIDLEPLAKLTYALGGQYLKKTMTDVLSWDEKLEDVIVEADGVDLAPADIRLAAIEISMAWADNREIYLKTALDLLNMKYDYIIMNCTASLSFMTINALYACDAAILATDKEIKGVEDLDDEMTMALSACEELLHTKAAKVDGHADVYDQIFDRIEQNRKVIILDRLAWDGNKIKGTSATVPSCNGDMSIIQEILEYTVHLN